MKKMSLKIKYFYKKTNSFDFVLTASTEVGRHFYHHTSSMCLPLHHPL